MSIKIKPPTTLTEEEDSERNAALANLTYAGTDDANARLLADWYGADLIWVKGLGWLCWDDQRFAADEVGALRYGREAGQQIYKLWQDEQDQHRREQLQKLCYRLGNIGVIRSALDLARTELAAGAQDLDADPWLFNEVTGTIDLTTGKETEHDRGDKLTKLAPVRFDPDVRHPMWDKFIEKATHCAECAAFLQRAVGYTLVGRHGKNGVYIVHGPSQRGKSTFVGAVQNALGDYAGTARIEALTDSMRAGGHNDDIASLRGRRMVVVSEASESDRLKEGLLKQLAGGDSMHVSFKGSPGFEMTPVLSLWMSTNHIPRMRGDDSGLRTRLYRIRFMNKIDNRVKQAVLSEKCRPAILAWAVQGCLDWQEHRDDAGENDEHDGLRPPPCVLAANAEMWDTMDDYGRFMEDRLESGRRKVATNGQLDQAYAHWADHENTPERYRVNPKTRANRLEAEGAKAIKDSHGIRGRGWLGVTVLPCTRCTGSSTRQGGGARF